MSLKGCLLFYNVFVMVQSFLKMILFIFQLWRKFGDAKNDGPGPNPSTTTVTDDVFLILTTNKEVNDLTSAGFSYMAVVTVCDSL